MGYWRGYDENQFTFLLRMTSFLCIDEKQVGRNHLTFSLRTHSNARFGR